jgi:hypothetical protein
MKKLLLILLLYILIGYSKLYSQINLQLLPTKEFNLISDDLINITLQSPTTENVDLQISAKHLESNQILFIANLLNFSVSTQTSFINSKTYNLTIQFNSTNLFNGSKFLKSGTYKVCVVVKTHNQAEELASECEEYKNFPINPPMLLNPEDNGEVNNLQPILYWIPPTPIYDTKNINYKLNLVTINPGQNQFEAISSNSPLLSTTVQSITNLIYPINAMPLNFGKSYAWQVEALDGNISLGKTEIWKFQIQRDSIEELKEKYRMMSFILLAKPGEVSRIYETNEDLKIVYEGIVLEDTKIEIFDVNNKSIQVVDAKQVFVIGGGRYVINLDQISSIKTNKTYTVQITAAKETRASTFTFKRSKE